ncbi:MAG TPA: class I SAM-dependent methyltransferase [Candidatus Limiplasma sp.]|nr:class I SAM-dependent methyltransferase [Candidatus Limiplasma sp.]HPS80361.1 class I SAM-dependent methyltransferase [Candidatus Limiplasma sp.]
MITKAQSKRYSRRPPLEKKPRLSALEKGLLRWTMAERGDKVLDAYVVGSGLMLEYLQRNMECEICGVSDDMGSVRQARSRLRNADIVYASREDIPWRENTFDSVYLKMITAPLSETAMREILRVLKPGGQVLVGFQTIPAPFRQIAAIFRPETDDELHRPKARGQLFSMMKNLGLTQLTWQRTDLLHGVGIAWKALDAAETEKAQ